MNDAERIEYLEERVAKLEDVLVELAPFAACYEVRAETTLAAPSDELAIKKGQMFKRDTLYLDKHVYRRLASLMKDRLMGAGLGYIFE